MQRSVLLKNFSSFAPALRQNYHNAMQRRFLASVKDVFPHKTDFPSRHIGPRKTEVVAMLDLLGFKVSSNENLNVQIILLQSGKTNETIKIIFLPFSQSLDELTSKAVPKHIQLRRDLKLDEPLSK